MSSVIYQSIVFVMWSIVCIYVIILVLLPFCCFIFANVVSSHLSSISTQVTGLYIDIRDC